MSTRPRSSRTQVSLARMLSKFGLASRSQAMQWIANGRVTVNGSVTRSPGRWVDPRRDRVSVDGLPLRAAAMIYLAMNKPVGFVTTRSDERGRSTVYDLLLEHAGWVFPVGRLDKDTSGLLLFTNDTKFGERITGPESGIPKTYVVHIDRPMEAAHRRTMEEGMRLKNGEVLLPARVVPAPGGMQHEIAIREGKNRQVRNMFEHFGYTVLALQRTRIGPVALGRLAPGKVRTLLPAEVRALSGRAEGVQG